VFRQPHPPSHDTVDEVVGQAQELLLSFGVQDVVRVDGLEEGLQLLTHERGVVGPDTRARGT
jgi:hypothetical protein